MTTIKQRPEQAFKRCAMRLVKPGYQTRSLFFSDRQTIEPGPKAHKPANSGAVVGNGARMCSLSEYLEVSFKQCLFSGLTVGIVMDGRASSRASPLPHGLRKAPSPHSSLINHWVFAENSPPGDSSC